MNMAEWTTRHETLFVSSLLSRTSGSTRSTPPHAPSLQDITIRRLEDVIAEFEDGAEAKAEQEAAARAKQLEEVSIVGAGSRRFQGFPLNGL